MELSGFRDTTECAIEVRIAAPTRGIGVSQRSSFLQIPLIAGFADCRGDWDRSDRRAQGAGPGRAVVNHEGASDQGCATIRAALILPYDDLYLECGAATSVVGNGASCDVPKFSRVRPELSASRPTAAARSGGLDLYVFPPTAFVARIVQGPVMCPAKRHGELVAHFAPQSSGLGEPEVVSIGRRASADEARLRADEAQMLLIAADRSFWDRKPRLTTVAMRR